MPTISLPTPGLTTGPAWASQLNTAINTVNDDINTRLSDSALNSTIEAAVPEAGAGFFSPVAGGRPGNRCVYLGDSITQGSDLPGTDYNSVSYPTYASLYSGQRLLKVRNAGIAGNTTAAMLARFDTDVTPWAPNVVVLLAGTNDLGGTAIAHTNWIATMEAIIAKIRAIGAVPVIGETPPSNTSANKQRVTRQNTWKRTYAAENGIPLIPFYALLTDPTNGDWKSAYYNDGTHPNAAGTAAMGQLCADTLSAQLPPFGPPLCSDDTDALNTLYRGTFASMTGTALPAAGWIDGAGASGSAISYITDSAVPGKMLTVTQTAGAQRVIQEDIFIGATTLTNAVSAGATSLVIPIRADYAGVLYIGSGATFEAVKILSSAGGGPQTETLVTALQFAHAAGETVIASAAPGDELIYTGVVTSNGGVTVTADVVATGAAYSPAAIAFLPAPITRGVFYQRFTVLPSTTKLTVRMRIAAGTGVVSFGQMGLYNATRLGI